MNHTGKVRAGRNRTLTMTERDIEIYANKSLNIMDMPYKLKSEGDIINGDCFEILPLLPDAFVDLLIVDPPYNLSKDYGSTQFRKMNAEDYADFTRRWIAAAAHTLKPTATIYVCCDWQTSMIIGSILASEYIVRNRITWQREKGRGANANWKNCSEDIWFATVSNDYVFNVDAVKVRRKVIAPYRENGKPKDWVENRGGNFRDTFPSNIWDDITIPYWSMPENTDHPTQKPEKLMAKLILASSNEGDVVLDPFAGSGTSAVVAKKLKRRYVGIEVNREYCAWAQKRLEIADYDKEIQGYAGGVFWERNTFGNQTRC